MTETDRETLHAAARVLNETGWTAHAVKLTEIASRFPEALASRTPEGTVRVRIAVAVTPNKNWHAAGCCGTNDVVASDWATSRFPSALNQVVHWIEADVPIPQTQTVEGQVTR